MEIKGIVGNNRRYCPFKTWGNQMLLIRYELFTIVLFHSFLTENNLEIY